MKFQLHRHRNLLAGFFVSTAAITFVVSLIVLFHKKGVFEMQYTLSAVFENGVGLRPGADVLFNGVKIGRVESVNLLGRGGIDVSSGKVVLNLLIDRKYQDFITSRSVAFALRDKNLVSDRVVNIETLGLGGTVLKGGDTLAVSNSRDIESVLSGLTKLMGKMDQLINSIDEIVVKTKDPNTTVGAMLGSRDLYDRLLYGVNSVDTAVGQGRAVLSRVQLLTDTLHVALGGILARADSTSGKLVRTAEQAEKLSVHANVLAGQGETILRRMDQLMLQGAGKIDQAGDLMDAVSSLWFIKGKMAKKGEYPVLLNEAGP
ncbi:MAG TPA: MlaD family protein [Fibrobacteria bacterium]|nr:MlaD family protein [Fibrobacteria bacterium]